MAKIEYLNELGENRIRLNLEGEDGKIGQIFERYMELSDPEPIEVEDCESEESDDGWDNLYEETVRTYTCGWDHLIAGTMTGLIKLRIGDQIKSDEFGICVVTDIDDKAYRIESRECVFVSSFDEIDNKLDDIYKSLPEFLRVSIMETDRPHLDKDGNKVSNKSFLFLPAASEIFDEANCCGDKGLYKQLDWYKDRRNRMRRSGSDSDDTSAWWSSSARSGYTMHACIVLSAGLAYAYYTSTSYGAPVCFRIQKSD